MNRHHRIPTILLACLLLAVSISSCREFSHKREIRDALAHAETLMATDPHAARAVLDSLNPHSSSPFPNSSFLIPHFSKGEAADWAWLKVQTDYKCYIPLTSDSLARIATAYYGTPRHKNYHAAMAWYTLGCVYTETNDDPKAVDAYLTAQELFPDTVNRYYVIALFNTGKHFLNRHMYSEAEACFLTAKSNPYCLRDSLQAAYTDFNLGLAHMYQNRYRHAEEDFYAVLRNTHTPTLLRKDIDYQLARLNFYESKDCATSLSHVNRFISQAENPKGIAAAWVLKGNIMAYSELYDSAYACYQKALECHTDIYARNQANKLLAHISQLTQKNDSAEHYSMAYQSSLDSIYNNYGREEIDSIRNAHLLEVRQRATASRALHIAGIGVATLVGVGVLLWLGRRRQRRLHLAPAVLPTDATPSDNMTLQEKAALCRERFQQSALFPQLLEELSQREASSKMSQSRREEIRKAVADATAAIRSELMLECPLLTKEDLEFCEYMLLGFSIKAMAKCSTYSEHALESRKSRIKNKVSSEWREILFSSNEFSL